MSRTRSRMSNFDAQNEATNGLLIRLQALNQLSDNDFTVNAARFLLFLLFLVIECLPVTVKLMQQPEHYLGQPARAAEASRLTVQDGRDSSLLAPLAVGRER